jgi:hypothetical protein
MSRRDGAVLAGALLVFTAIYGGLPWLAGGLFLDTHEGDSYHFLDVLIRMAERGQVPHIDFVTPLGILTFWAIVGFMKLGIPAGTATILAQGALALALLPLVAYAATSRMTRGTGYLFGFFTLGLVLALSYGGTGSGVTISMHYNRWAWGIAFVMLALALLPASRPRPGLDCALVGMLAALLLLLKVTYFVTLVPVAALAVARGSGTRGFIAALLGGSVPILAVTLALGPDFWLAYFNDLRLVAGSEVRPYVGVPLGEIVSGPAYLGATLLGIAAIILVRRAGHEAIGTCVALLIPGFIYISYQNFGNDPQWLLFLPVLLLALRPSEGSGEVLGIDLRRAMGTTAALAIAVFFPSLVNIALSPINHLAFDKSRFLPMIPEAAGHQDIFIRKDRAYSMTAQIFKDMEPGPWARYAEAVERPGEQQYGGVTFPHCEWMAGSRAFFEVLSEDMERAGIPAGSRIFTADILAAFWLFGPWEPPEQGAPWYYGGLTGVENADFILIPKCSFVGRVRGIVIDDLEASGLDVTLERDTDLYALFRVGEGEPRISLSR